MMRNALTDFILEFGEKKTMARLIINLRAIDRFFVSG